MDGPCLLAMNAHLEEPEPELVTDLAVEGGQALLRVQGEVDLVTAPRLQGALASACDLGRDVVVDLNGVAFMDSTGLRALLQARDIARRLGGSLRLDMAEDGQVARLLELAGVRPLFS